MDKFAKWFRHDMDDWNFIWNLFMLVITEGLWLVGMLMFYAVDSRRGRKR